jgi:hypothetical protein
MDTKDTIRVVREGDQPLIKKLAESQGMATPEISHSTIVAETAEGNIRAVAVIRDVVQLEWLGENSKAGHVSSLRVLQAAENMMKSHGIKMYFIGVDAEAEAMNNIVARLGFTNLKEVMFGRVLDDVLG